MADALTLYFAYGSNMSAARMAVRCPGAQFVGIARLDNWRFVINDRGVATVEPREGCRTWGVMWMLAPEHVASLDYFESVAHGLYRQEFLPIVPKEGEQRTALVYVENNYREYRPAPGYLEIVLRGANEHGLPSGYIREIEEWARREFGAK